MADFGTINYAGTDWTVVAFIGSAPGVSIVMQPNTEPVAASVIAEWMSGEDPASAAGSYTYEAADLIGYLNDHGFNILANSVDAAADRGQAEQEDGR